MDDTIESSAPKRRRTSPRTSIPIFNGQTDPAPSPSYASPTRASLARFNPEILERRDAAQRAADRDSRPRSTSQASEVSLRALTVARDTGATGQHQDVDTEPAEAGSQSPIRSAPRRPKGSRLRETLSAHLQQRIGITPTAASQALGRSDSHSSTGIPSRNPARPSDGGLGAAPKRSPSKPKPRPLPPAESGSEEELLNPFARRGLRRTPPGGMQPLPRESPFVVPADNEPELPPTPTQQGKDDPVVTTPPSGIHDTPLRRARRRSGQGKKNSPLKHQSFPTAEDPGTPSKSKGTTTAFVVEDDPDAVVDDEERTPGTRGGGGTHPARGIPPTDAHAEKRALRDELQAEVARLEADLRFATSENETLHQLQQRQRKTPQPPSPPQQHGEELLGLLQRYLLPSSDEETTPPDPSQLLFDAAMDPTSWLSFSAVTPAPIPAPPPGKDSPAPVSHHPIPMTADEELGFLRAFTPFEFSSTTTIPPREHADAPLLRQHSMSIRDPNGFFAAKLEMVVNTDTLRIDQLRVPRLDPAAISELGPFVETICAGKQNSAMDRNVSILGWAMAEWHRISVERARVWCLLEREVADRGRLLEIVGRMRKRKRPGRRAQDDEEGEGGTDSTGTAEGAGEFPRAALLAHMGRTNFEVPLPDDGEEDESRWPCLRIQWRIEFDWTGEGVSRVGVLLGVPGKCKSTAALGCCRPLGQSTARESWEMLTILFFLVGRVADDSGALAGVQKVFGDLVKGDENPLNAVRAVASLLVGDVSTTRRQH